MTVFKKYPFLFLSAAGIILISVFSSRIIPIYDGIGAPDEQYRYSKPPSSQKTATLPPSPAEVSVEIKDSTNQSDFGLASKEQGPQVNIYVYRLAVNAPATNTKITFKAAPKVPESTQTPKGNIAGNAYHLSVADNSGAVTFSSNNKKGYIDLRIPQGYYAPATMVFRKNQSEKWQPLKTSRVGNDIYEASIVEFGDYALVPPATNSAIGNKSPLLKILVLFIILIILLAALIVVRNKHAKTGKNKK
jgi:hypothetical protein